MDPERWHKITALFQSALGRDAGERAAFLERECGDDSELRREVEKMIRSHESAGSVMERPAYERGAALLAGAQEESLVGRTLGHYRIVRLLGAGGMGKVYLAEDARLGRRAAVKVLPARLTEDPSLVARFRQEARAASSLSHPGVVTIYEVGEEGGTHFIATEYVEGVTLRERMSRAALGVAEALSIASQIASALAKAHAAGIVHRDIKPENVMIDAEGHAKVLDFGIAKLTEEARASATEAPTVLKIDTGPGTVMGTVHYMSPEQARGKPVDERTDVWSLGVVLYEMLAGRRPFEGETASDVISAILNREPPPLARYSREVSDALDLVVQKALAKERGERYRTAQELLADLRRVGRRLGAGADADAHDTAGTRAGATAQVHTASSAEYIVTEIRRHKLAAVLAVSVAAVALAGGGYGLYKLLNRDAPPRASLTINKLTTHGRVRGEAAVSPDGKYVVYATLEAGKESLWVKQVSTGSTVQVVPPVEAGHRGLAFSKDGDHLYFVRWESDRSHALYRMPALGGPARKLIPNVDGAVSFSPDGRRLAFIAAHNPEVGDSSLMVADADGTNVRRIATRSRANGESFPWWRHQGPAWSPDGKRIACVVGGARTGSAPMRLVEFGAEGGAETPIGERAWYEASGLSWLADGGGLLMIAAEGPSDYFAQQVWHVSYPGGAARKVTSDFDDYFGLSLTADSGSFVAVRRQILSSVWVAPGGDTARAAQITSPNSNYEGHDEADITPDGKQIVYHSRAGGREDIWVMNADGTGQRQLTFEGDASYDCRVCGDGRHVVFASERAGRQNVWRIDIDGGNLKQLTDGGSDTNPFCTPDGRWVFYDTGYGLWKVSSDGGEPVHVAKAMTEAPFVSPDGKYVGCEFRERAEAPWRVAILSSATGEPVKFLDLPQGEVDRGYRFTPDGRSIAYVETENGVSNIWSRPLEGGPPRRLTDFKTEQIFNYSWARDARSLVLVRGTATRDVVMISGFR